MGDSCNVVIKTISTRELTDEERGLIESEELDPNDIGEEVDLENINYAGYELRQVLQKCDIGYLIYWGSGCEFGPGSEVFWPGVGFAEVEHNTGGRIVCGHPASKKDKVRCDTYKKMVKKYFNKKQK